VSEALVYELKPEWKIKVSRFLFYDGIAVLILGLTKVIMVEFGGFPTPGYLEAPRLPTHAAYLDSSGNPFVPNLLKRPAKNSCAKAGEVLWRLSREGNPPLRLALGQDAMFIIKGQAEEVAKGVVDNAAWSADLLM
jgi:hypothetical protein